MQIEPIVSTNGMDQNSYLVYTDNALVIIDAGCDISVLNSTLIRLNLASRKIDAVILTHTHFDHIFGLYDIFKAFCPPIYIHKDCTDFLFDKIKNASCYFDDFNLPEVVRQNIVEVFDNQCLSINDLTFKFLFTPGHSKCSMCILVNNSLFTGDTILQGSVGRTDLFGGSYAELQNSLNRIKSLTFDTAYPGHGRALSYNLVMGIIRFNKKI